MSLRNAEKLATVAAAAARGRRHSGGSSVSVGVLVDGAVSVSKQPSHYSDHKDAIQWGNMLLFSNAHEGEDDLSSSVCLHLFTGSIKTLS